MFSRVILIGICLSGFLTACSVRFNRPAAAPPTVSVRARDTQCLSHLTQDIQDYFEARATSEQIETFWDCATRSLEFFTRYVKGSDGNTYAPNELRAFLELYFLGDLKISDGMLNQAMRFKQVLFGRSATELNAADIADLGKFLKLLKQISLSLRPYVAIYTLKIPSEGLDKTTLESAALALEGAVQKLSEVMVKSQTDYRLEDLQLLLTEIQLIFDHTTGWQGPSVVRGHMPLFNLVRTLYTGGNIEEMQPTEWGPALNAGTRIFFEWLRYKYVLGKDDWRFGEGLETITHFIYEAFQILEEAVSNQPDHQLSYAKLGAVLDLLSERQWLPLDISAATYKDLLTPVFSKMLRPIERVSNQANDEAVTLDAVHQAQIELQNWYMAQKWVAEQASPRTRQAPGSEFVRPRSWANFVKLFGSKYNWEQHQSVKEMKRLMTGPVHLLLDSNTILSFTRENRLAPYDLYSLSALNWRRLVIGLAVRGYVTFPAPGASPGEYKAARKRVDDLEGLTLDEFHEFYNQVRPLGEELHFLDPRDTKIWQTLFDEANMFTFRGDGDRRLSFEEGVEIMTMVFSSGSINRSLWRQMVEDLRTQQVRTGRQYVGDLDVFGQPMLAYEQFTLAYRAHFADTYKHLPAIMKEYRRLQTLAAQGDQQPLEDFFKSLEKVAVSSMRQDGFVESGALDKFTMMLHYVEVIYMIYDRPDPRTAQSDGLLSSDEVTQAFARIKRVLREKTEKMGQKLSDDELLGLLTYMAAYGRLPNPDNWASFDGAWIWLWMKTGPHSFLAPPLNMMRIFAEVRGMN